MDDVVIPVVLVIYCGKDPCVPRFHFFVQPPLPTTLFDQPLYRPKGSPIFRWATDYVSCCDERWAVLGPYKDAGYARYVATEVLPQQCLRGWRIVNEHCWEALMSRMGGNAFVAESWTDG